MYLVLSVFIYSYTFSEVLSKACIAWENVYSISLLLLCQFSIKIIKTNRNIKEKYFHLNMIL